MMDCVRACVYACTCKRYVLPFGAGVVLLLFLGVILSNL